MDLQYSFVADGRLPSGRFLIQDVDLRLRIMPLFKFSSAQPGERIEGQGTVFRTDPWGNCITAFHVFEDAFYLGGSSGRDILVRQDRSIVALEVEGLAYGAARVQPYQWRTIIGAHSIVRVETLPFQTPQLRNFTEVLALSIPPSAPKIAGVEYLNVDLSSWRPKVGELVLGVGYPNLDKAEEGASDNRPISQHMFGSYGRITDIEPLDLRRGRPWPMVRVDADWAGGMSGGPVFNAAGNVIGIISSGVDAASSSAMIFGGWNAVSNTLGSLDPARPGWFLCRGVLDSNEHLIGVYFRASEAEAVVAQREGALVSRLSYHQATGQFVRLEL